MKKILIALLLSLRITSYAQEFTLEISNDNRILHNDADWQFVAQTNIYQLSVDKKVVASSESILAVHSLTEFHNPNGQKYDIIDKPVYKIYTYGILDCPQAVFSILRHWFVDKSNKIVYTQENDVGSYLVEMSTNNTPRNDLYRLVCNK